MKPWWTTEPVLRLLSDLILAEVARLRPGMSLQGSGQLRGLGAATDGASAGASAGFVGTGVVGAGVGEGVGDGAGASEAAIGAAAALLADLDSLEFLDLATTLGVLFHLDRTGLDQALMTDRHLETWAAILSRSRAHWDEAISFHTSGSTGRPKLCIHSLALMEEEIAFFAGLLRDRRRLLSAVPSHHIYGFLFSFMLPALLGIPVHDVRGALPGRVLRQAEPGDLLIGHPLFFDLATRGPVAVGPDIIAVSSTAPLPTELWHRLADTGLAGIMEVYGASETAGIGMRRSPAEPFRLLPHWSRVAINGQEIARQSPAGVPVLAELPDQVEWIDAERFQVRGRRDGAVQIGGINVFPQRVADCIREHPEVADALVRLDSQAGNGRLKAFVVPSGQCRDARGLPERLDAWLAERLAPAERPRSFTIGGQLPRSTLGKPADWT